MSPPDESRWETTWSRRAWHHPLRTLTAAGCAVLSLALSVAVLVVDRPREEQVEAAAEPSGAQARVTGADRFATAAAVSRRGFPSAATVYVTSGLDFADAIAAAPAAGADGAPILLTRPSDLPGPTVAELERLRPDRIVVVGGTRAVSERVVASLSRLARHVERRAGADRYATAARLAGAFDAPASTVFVTTGQSYGDALSAGAAGAASSAPLLLTAREALPDATQRALERLRPSVIEVVGGTSAISDQVVRSLRGYASTVHRRAGRDRYGTAVAVSAGLPTQVKGLVVASGESYVDALTAGPLAAGGRRLLLANRWCLPPDVRAEAVRLGTADALVIGGLDRLGPAVDRLTSCTAPVVGTNYTHHHVDGCDMDDGGLLLTYHDAGVRATARSQLSAMTTAGIRSLRLVVWHAPNLGNHRWGLVPAGDGRIEEPFRSNLVAFLRDVRVANVERLTVAMSPLGRANPIVNHVGPDVVENNWRVLRDVRELARLHGPAQLRFDLLNEGATPQTVPYLTAMYGRYARSFGTSDVTVSIIASGTPESTEERTRSLLDAVDRSGHAPPTFFEVHLAYDGDGALQGLRTVDRVLTERRVDAPLVVGETAYESPAVADAIRRFVDESPQRVLEVLPWPLHPSRPCPHLSVSPPYAADAYLDRLASLP